MRTFQKRTVFKTAKAVSFGMANRDGASILDLVMLQNKAGMQVIASSVQARQD